ncbi:MAG: LuxR family transcriptional regulator [Betaproteobacteria bacterium]|nr:LuxR family transcriptional regulator [Betaproteobacteria bacterium]
MNPRRAAWLDQVLAATSLAGLQTVIGRFGESLGFRYYVYRGRFPGLQEQQAEVCIDGFPPAWRSYRAEHGLDGHSNPIRRRALSSVTPILWHEFLPGYPQFYRDRRRFGLVTGLTCPLHAPRGEWSAMSLGSAQAGALAERRTYDALAECHLLVGFVHEAVRRILEREQRRPGSEAHSPPLQRLSSRERDCLLLTSAGQTTGGIGKLLGIAGRTVTFHLANARRKLGALNTRHAVSRAITLGLLTTD